MKLKTDFDASVKIPNFPSLNIFLETEIYFIVTIPSILAKFRFKEIGVICNITFYRYLCMKKTKNAHDFFGV